MPSFISDSELADRRSRPDRFTIILLSTMIVILALLEFVSRERFDSTSRVQRRETAERKVLLAIRDTELSQNPHIVLVGNSLMLEGIDLPLLQSKLHVNYTPVPYFVLGTNYYDWFFGLRRLFAEGMRPRYILLGLSPNQLASSDVRGDISARYLVQDSDLLELVRRTHMDATRASEFILAHYSEFYSTREITRGFVLSRVLPSVGDMLHTQYAGFRDPTISDSVLKPLAESRLAAIDQLCRKNGAHFLFVVPPTYQKGAETILAAGQEGGIAVLPIEDAEFDASYYQEDGIHMNEKGSRIFTTRLAGALNGELSK